MSRTKLFAVLLGLFSVLMTGVWAELEGRAIRTVMKQTANSAGASDPTGDDQISVIRDQFRMFLIFGGGFGGAVVCVLLRLSLTDPKKVQMTRVILGAYFTVSFLSSVFCTPFLLRYYSVAYAEACFAGSFVLATSVWGVWEVVIILLARIKQAAVDRGWLGVIGEIKGNTSIVSATPPVSEAVAKAASDPVPKSPSK